MNPTQRRLASTRWLAPLVVLVVALVVGLTEDVRAGNDDLDVAEAKMRQRFLNLAVLVKIDRPANEDGVYIRAWQQPAIDIGETQERIDEHGVSLSAYGQLSLITDIKRKRKHLEFHLDGGGWSGRVPSVPQFIDRSPEEIALGLPARPEPEDVIRRRRAELAKERTREDDKAYDRYLEEADEYERNKIAAGSRFNLRYRHALTARELTPESIMEALGAYVDFGVD